MDTWHGYTPDGRELLVRREHAIQHGGPQAAWLAGNWPACAVACSVGHGRSLLGRDAEGVDRRIDLHGGEGCLGRNEVRHCDNVVAGGEPVVEGADLFSLERTARVRAERNADEARRALDAVRETARGDGNLLVPMRDALRGRATIGEISNTLRDEFGMYDAQRV